MEQCQSRAGIRAGPCQCDRFQCLLLCDSCFQRLAALQQHRRGEWCGQSSSSLPCPSETVSVLRTRDIFVVLVVPCVFLRREEATGAQTLGWSALQVRQAALGGLQCLAQCPHPRADREVCAPWDVCATSLGFCAHCEQWHGVIALPYPLGQGKSPG